MDKIIQDVQHYEDPTRKEYSLCGKSTKDFKTNESFSCTDGSHHCARCKKIWEQCDRIHYINLHQGKNIIRLSERAQILSVNEEVVYNKIYLIIVNNEKDKQKEFEIYVFSHSNVFNSNGLKYIGKVKGNSDKYFVFQKIDNFDEDTCLNFTQERPKYNKAQFKKAEKALIKLVKENKFDKARQLFLYSDIFIGYDHKYLEKLFNNRKYYHFEGRPYKCNCLYAITVRDEIITLLTEEDSYIKYRYEISDNMYGDFELSQTNSFKEALKFAKKWVDDNGLRNDKNFIEEIENEL